MLILWIQILYMRITTLSLLFSCLFIAFTSSTCKKKNEEPQLPPETTTGAMTFGCKINGKVFVPRGGSGRPGLKVDYQYVATGSEPGWYFVVAGADLKNSILQDVLIMTDSLMLTENTTYSLKKKKGFAFGEYQREYEYFTILDDTAVNTLHIKRLDPVSRIVSGTFQFTAKTSAGAKVEITEGRFDVRF